MRPFFIGARCSCVTGELTGHFLALDARIGEVLYRSELPLIGGDHARGQWKATRGHRIGVSSGILKGGASFIKQ